MHDIQRDNVPERSGTNAQSAGRYCCRQSLDHRLGNGALGDTAVTERPRIRCCCCYCSCCCERRRRKCGLHRSSQHAVCLAGPVKEQAALVAPPARKSKAGGVGFGGRRAGWRAASNNRQRLQAANLLGGCGRARACGECLGHQMACSVGSVGLVGCGWRPLVRFVRFVRSHTRYRARAARGCQGAGSCLPGRRLKIGRRAAMTLVGAGQSAATGPALARGILARACRRFLSFS